jgi:hypothetical protein
MVLTHFESSIWKGNTSNAVDIKHSKRLPNWFTDTVDSRLYACGFTALGVYRGNVFLKKKFYFPWVSHLFKCFVCQSMLVYYNLEDCVYFSVYVIKFQCIKLQ